VHIEPGAVDPHAPVASLLQNLFDLDLGVDEKILRALLVFLVLVVALRIGGKRELAQLNVLDFAVLLLVSNVLQNAMIGNDNTVTGGFIGATTLFVANYTFVRLTFRFSSIRRLLEGKPRILLEDGRLRPEALAKESIRETELLDAALERNFDSLDDVGLIALETNGHITVLKKGEQVEDWKSGQMTGVEPAPPGRS
jgi:uncharacterized membrane protein YcaP (DUF421 family)